MSVSICLWLIALRCTAWGCGHVGHKSSHFLTVTTMGLIKFIPPSPTMPWSKPSKKFPVDWKAYRMHDTFFVEQWRVANDHDVHHLHASCSSVDTTLNCCRTNTSKQQSTAAMLHLACLIIRVVLHDLGRSHPQSHQPLLPCSREYPFLCHTAGSHHRVARAPACTECLYYSEYTFPHQQTQHVIQFWICCFTRTNKVDQHLENKMKSFRQLHCSKRPHGYLRRCSLH